MPQDSDSPTPEPLERLLGGTPGATRAIFCPDDGTSLSYDDLGAASERLAGLLRGAGVERGDCVALVLPNGPEIVATLLGIAMLGAIAAPLNPAYKVDEYAFYLEDLDPTLLLLPAGEYPNARRGAPGTVRIAELQPGEVTAARLTVHGGDVPIQPIEPASPDDVALLLHTSGTTSRPKQVPLTQRGLAYSARSIAAFYQLGGDDVSYCSMPLFHVHGLVASTLATLSSGGSVAIPRRYTSRGFWTQAAEHGVTWVSAGPTTHQMALEAQGDAPTPPSLRFVRSCSSALSPELMERAEAAYGAPVLQAYGMTEASHQIASNPLPPDRRVPSSVGVSAGAEARIFDSAGRELPPGESGEVVLRGPGVTEGYRNNPEANADAFVDGWFRTGDLGAIDDGYLFLKGRLKEMILRGGENISPYEVEAVLLSHPAVVEAVCFAVEDGKYGEVVGAAVALGVDTDTEQLADHCMERLAHFKVPTVIHVLDAIPRTATGKVQRSKIGASLAAEG